MEIINLIHKAKRSISKLAVLVHCALINLNVLVDTFESSWGGVVEEENPITKLIWKRQLNWRKTSMRKRKVKRYVLRP